MKKRIFPQGIKKVKKKMMKRCLTKDKKIMTSSRKLSRLLKHMMWFIALWKNYCLQKNARQQLSFDTPMWLDTSQHKSRVFRWLNQLQSSRGTPWQCPTGTLRLFT